MRSISYVVGFITGIAAVAIMYFILSKIAKKKGKNVDYDERQNIARGKAFKTGFKAFALCEIIAMCNEIGIGLHVMDSGVLHFVILLIGLSAFCIKVIWSDAYFLDSEKKKVWGFVMFFAVVLNLVIFFFLSDDSLYSENGLLSTGFINLFCAIFCFIIFVNGIIKLCIDKKNEKEE